MSLKPIYQVLPLRIREFIQSLPRTILESLEEIRVRQDRPLEIITKEQSWFVNEQCQLSRSPRDSVIPYREECAKMLNLITNHSLYTMEEELKRGYVTIEGGHRIGLVGRVVVERGNVKYLRDVAGFNVRIAREVKGVGEPLLPILVNSQGLNSVLIISPPQCGKTTLIRDMARLASKGEGQFLSYKVGIVDERSEIAGCIDGVPQHDVGPRTDVLDACPKAEGMMMMIRSMSPELLVVDEIGRVEDSDAVREAIYAGVCVLATAHGASIQEVCQRPTLAELIEEKVFSRFIVLNRKGGPGTVDGIFDSEGQSISVAKKRTSQKVVRVL